MGGYATIADGPLGWVEVEFSFNVDAKDELKEKAGRGNYRWVAEEKVWLFRAHLVSMIERVLERHGFDVTNTTTHKQTSGSHQGPLGDPQAAWRAILKSLPKGLDHKLYHAGVRALHPDQGGDLQAMQTLNVAWGQHEQEVGMR